jgi:hypothetical protein
VDCPWREQTLWIDDQPFESLYYLELTADPVFPAHSLRMGAAGAQPDGMIPARYPSSDPMTFRSMPALWTLILHDYFLYTGDRALLRELLPVADKALSLYDTWRDADGLVPYEPGSWNFIDWGYDLNGIIMGGQAAPLNLLAAAALQCAARLHGALNETETARRMQARSRDLTVAVNRRFWLNHERRFYDCTEPADGRRTISQIPHALALHFGLLPPERVAAALEALGDPTVLRAEVGFQLFVLRALAGHGRAEQALRAIREVWGTMLASDSPTLWEVSQGRSPTINGRPVATSLCHGYAGAPIDFLQQNVLGVRPLRPGFAEFELNPRAVGSQWARGAVPTPHGLIAVEWVREPDDTLTVAATVPPATAAVLPEGRRLGPGRHTFTHRRTGRPSDRYCVGTSDPPGMSD